MAVVKWTKPQVETFIKNNIRACFRKYAPKEICYKMASLGKLKNPKTNRMAEHYKCADCGQSFPRKEVQCDHIDPVIDPKDGFKGWDEYIRRMLCLDEKLEADFLYIAKYKLQILCSDCHTIKSNKENEIRHVQRKLGKSKE